MSVQQQKPASRSWMVGMTSLLFILLQSACTAVMAISGVRVVIGLSALAAAAGLNRLAFAEPQRPRAIAAFVLTTAV